MNVPHVYINTQDGREVECRDVFVPMSITLRYADRIAHNFENLSGQIRGRGNSTWTHADKLSYRIRFDDRISLLGLSDERERSRERTWLLQAVAFDKTLLRDWTTWRIAEAMNFCFVPNSTFAHVYLNGEYLGLYQVTEAVQTGPGRVNIGESTLEREIGFMFSTDMRAPSKGRYGVDFFFIEGYFNELRNRDVPFRIRSDYYTREQFNFIRDTVTEIHIAIMSGDRARIEALIDIDSFVDMYILQEFTKDRDVAFGSLYFARSPGGKLRATAPWDFDLALGNDSGSDTPYDHQSPRGIMAARANTWFRALMSTPWFSELTYARWHELADHIEQSIESTLQMGSALRVAAERNFERWYIVWQVRNSGRVFEPRVIFAIKTYRGQVEYLAQWMRQRQSWLDGHFADVVATETE